MSYCLTSNNLGINKKRGRWKRKKCRIEFYFKWVGLGWKTYPQSWKVKKKIQNTLSIFKIYFKFYYCFERGAIVQNYFFVNLRKKCFNKMLPPPFCQYCALAWKCFKNHSIASSAFHFCWWCNHPVWIIYLLPLIPLSIHPSIILWGFFPRGPVRFCQLRF